MRLIICRHGETDRNAGGVVQGRADIPLNDRGRRQADALAHALRDVSLAAVVSSPLQRARDTAAAIAAEQHVPVTLEPDLVEMDLGEMEGLSLVAMRERYPEFLRTWASPEGPAVPIPGGESLVQVQMRAWSVVERLRERHAADAVAVVTHNFVLASLVCRAVGADLSAFRRFRHAVASRTVIDLREDRNLILQLNDVCHLDLDGLSPDVPADGPLTRSARGG